MFVYHRTVNKTKSAHTHQLASFEFQFHACMCAFVKKKNFFPIFFAVAICPYENVNYRVKNKPKAIQTRSIAATIDNSLSYG